MKDWGYYDQFIKELQKAYIEELNAKRASFTVRGGSKPILAAQAISSTKEEQRKEIAERTERIKKERQEDRFA